MFNCRRFRLQKFRSLIYWNFLEFLLTCASFASHKLQGTEFLCVFSESSVIFLGLPRPLAFCKLSCWLIGGWFGRTIAGGLPRAGGG